VRLPAVDGGLEARLLLERLLRLLVVVPEFRLSGDLVQLGYLLAFAVDVKDAPGERPGGSAA
jgi:hypothetical protein